MTDLDEILSQVSYQDELEADEDWYDDSGAKVVDSQSSGKSGEQFPGSDPFEIDTDDPLRNRGVPEKDIAKRIMSEYLKEDKAGRTALEIARRITTKILQVTDVAFSDILPDSTLEMIRKAAMNHGLDSLDIFSPDIARGITEFPFIKTIALLHHVCITPAAFDIPGTYTTCVRGVNTLKLILDTLSDREVIEILKKTWDVAVLLLGATRTRAHLVGENYLHLEDLNFLHAQHYRQEVARVLGTNLNQWSVCKRTIADLTREEMPPFIRPGELLKKIEGLDIEKEKFHYYCTPIKCEPDLDGKQRPKYHTPSCNRQSCQLIVPPRKSIPLFDSILINQRRMPAVKAFSFEKPNQPWWIPTTRKTMAISHLWKDGITGTREEGMNECLHRYFSHLAKKEGLDSYWIDCATIPEDPRKRRMMIEQINSTYNTAGFTLCMDQRIATLDLPIAEDEDAEKVRDYNEKTLLAIITSFWHRRAWTLLEGHKSTKIQFYRESGKLFDLKTALEKVLVDEKTETPLWIRACMAEFEAYMTDSLTPEAAGMLLVTRAASRPGDSELIWRLLTQPYTTRQASKAINPHPFYFADTVDLAFICSNAQRSSIPGLCWMPSKTKVTAWARQAYGGNKAEIVRTTNVHLRGKWYVKHGTFDHTTQIKWNSDFSDKTSAKTLEWKLKTGTFEFKLVQPVLLEDQGRPGECDRVIVLTRPCHQHFTFGQTLLEPLWHWETMVQLNESIQFKIEDIMTLNIGFDAYGYGSAPSIISQGQSLLALQAASMGQPTGKLQSASRINSLRISSDFLGRIPFSLAWGASIILLARTASAKTPNASTGVVDLSTWMHFPQDMQPIIFEWAALIPLTVYLSSFRSDFELAGEVSLQGRLSVGVIPKLWALGGIAKILRQGEVFFDSANAAGETLKVFDVQHGSVFNCYNSAATAAVASAAFHGGGGDPAIKEEDLLKWINNSKEDLERKFAIAKYEDGNKGTPGFVFEKLRDNRKIYGRRQILNVVDIRRVRVNGIPIDAKDPIIEEPRRVSGAGSKSWVKNALWFAEIVVIMGATATLFGAGCPGSGSLLLMGGVSRLCAHCTEIGRPPLFLENRETYEGCMLVAVHDNAAVWTLYRGDRGLIDSLLNKPMVAHVKPTSMSQLVFVWFRVAEILQVVAMTYVAGEKGWDALMLLILITVVWSFSKFFGYNKHAANWLKEEGFNTTAFGCEFPGRTELLGAVQLLSTQKRTIWMDSVISSCPRREVLLQRLGAVSCTLEKSKEEFNALTETDKSWVMSTWMQSNAGAALIKNELRKRLGELPGLEDSDPAA